MYHILKTQEALNPGSTISIQRGRNADVTDYILTSATGHQLMKCARFYGFRNIQNLVRKLKPARTSRLPGAARRANAATSSGVASGEYTYVEVMACPGGCTNGGGQMKIEDVKEMYVSESSSVSEKPNPQLQRNWLRQVDEAYFSASSDSEAEAEDEILEVEMQDAGDNETRINGVSISGVHGLLQHWSSLTGISVDKLVYTSYRKVESDVGKTKSKGSGDVERVAGLASSIGGGW